MIKFVAPKDHSDCVSVRIVWRRAEVDGLERYLGSNTDRTLL